MHRSEVGLFLSSNPHREIIVLTKKKCGSHGGAALEGAAWVLASMLDMPSRRRNHGATQENPYALQGPSAARLDPNAAVVPRVQPVCHRPVQTSLDRIERESRLPSHTLVDPP